MRLIRFRDAAGRLLRSCGSGGVAEESAAKLGELCRNRAPLIVPACRSPGDTRRDRRPRQNERKEGGEK